jgi:hypothetical protein
VIVGCYSLDLYCDYCDRNSRTGLTVPDQFSHESGPGARQQARARGWRLDLEKDKAMCPTCVRNLANPPKQASERTDR